MPDHEVALGHTSFPGPPKWTSGFDLAHGATILIHDAQYTEESYADRVGWGHSTMRQLLAFADQTEVETVVTFHHDPEHSDDMLDASLKEVEADMEPDADVIPGTVGTILEL